MPGGIVDKRGFNIGLEAEKGKLSLEAVSLPRTLKGSHLEYRFTHDLLVDGRVFNRSAILLRN
jgi:hypothetical protein